jgi:GDPmannose 4,6-dehydratase
MLTLLEQDAAFEAVIGSGETHSIQEWVATCFALAGLDWTMHVRQKEGFVPEYTRLCSNPARIRGMGWRPRVSFTDLAAMMMHS